jgi:hypothetical protein
MNVVGVEPSPVSRTVCSLGIEGSTCAAIEKVKTVVSNVIISIAISNGAIVVCSLFLFIF